LVTKTELGRDVFFEKRLTLITFLQQEENSRTSPDKLLSLIRPLLIGQAKGKFGGGKRRA
jgi:hypothetical protein